MFEGQACGTEPWVCRQQNPNTDVTLKRKNLLPVTEELFVKLSDGLYVYF